jgi:hypothetical protein
LQSDGSRWNVIANYDGAHANAQQGATGQPVVGAHAYFNSNSNFTSPITLPASAPYIGFEFNFYTAASFATVINTTNTDMTVAATVTAGNGKVFKWSGAKWLMIK